MDHGDEWDFPSSSWFGKDKVTIAQPWMKVPPREFDQGPWKIRSIGKSHRKAPWQSALSRLDPNLPIHARRSKRQMVTGNSIDHGTPDHNTADQPSCKHFLGIAEKQRCRNESNAGFLLQFREHRVDGGRSFCC